MQTIERTEHKNTLTLRRETLRRLTDADLRQVVAGTTTTGGQNTMYRQ